MAAASADVTTGKTSNSIKSSQRAVHCARSARSSHSMIWKQRRKSSVTQVATYRKPLRHESALVAKAPVHRQRVAVPKVLDDPASKTTSRLRCNSTSAGTVGRRQPVRIPPPPLQSCRECRWLRDRPCWLG